MSVAKHTTNFRYEWLTGTFCGELLGGCLFLELGCQSNVQPCGSLEKYSCVGGCRSVLVKDDAIFEMRWKSCLCWDWRPCGVNTALHRRCTQRGRFSPVVYVLTECTSMRSPVEGRATRWLAHPTALYFHTAKNKLTRNVQLLKNKQTDDSHWSGGHSCSFKTSTQQIRAKMTENQPFLDVGGTVGWLPIVGTCAKYLIKWEQCVRHIWQWLIRRASFCRLINCSYFYNRV